MISCVLYNLPLSRNQPLGWVDDLYIGIVKNETKILINLRRPKKNKKINSFELN
jgi:hypothetical protein